MKTYQTISGHEISYEPTPEVAALLARLQAMLEDPAATQDQMIALAYGQDNPILDPNVIPGRGAVTPRVLEDPAYRVMTDILFRKRLDPEGDQVARIAKQHTLTPAQVAERLGVHVSAVRQAIE